jgi:hypothetical protein
VRGSRAHDLDPGDPMGIIDQLLAPFKSSARQAQGKAKRMQSMPKSRMNSEINKGTSKVTSEVNKAKPKL